jgi:plastocyanin
MRVLRHLMGAAALMAAISCGSSSSSDSPTGPGGNTGGNGGSTSHSISVGDDFFSPTATTVPVGTTVTWTWSGAIGHNVTFSDGVASPTQASGTYSRTFGTAGSFTYHCTIHPTAMTGTITVQ